MWIFTKAFLAGELIPVFNDGDMSRDFTYIDESCDRLSRSSAF